MNFRLRFFYAILRPLVIVFLKIKFGYKFKKAKKLPENYIVLSNHMTDFDPLFVGASFSRQMTFVASEHIARWGWIYKLLKFAFEPIIRYKGAAGGAAVIEMMRRVRKGGNVCMFAEGVRTWDGVTSPILPSTAAVIQKAGCGLVTYKITGGYFVSPMWGGASTRRGHITGAPVNVYTKEMLAQMTTDEIYRAINEDLHEDAYARQLQDPKPYRGKRLAEKLERLMFLCPTCRKMDIFTSSGDLVTCSSCGQKIRYDEYGMLTGIPYGTVKEFSDWQKERVKEDAAMNKEYAVEGAVLKTVDSKHEETVISEGKAFINADEFTIGETKIDMKDISFMAMHGQRAIVFTANKTYYEFVPTSGCNTLKIYLYYNAVKGNLL